MKSNQKLKTIVLFCATLGSVALCPLVSKATPYASEITNNAGTVSFFLNESGGNVTITYEDGSTNASYNGITTGTGLASGLHSFSLGAHTSYSISVFKTGSGVASELASYGISAAGYVDVDKNVGSPSFGKVYGVSRGSATPIYLLNSDLSYETNGSAGVSWGTAYYINVGTDDFVNVSDYSSAKAAIWRLAPDLSASTLLLGPVGDSAGTTAGVHGEPIGTPLLLGSPSSSGGATLLTVDSDFIPSFAPAGSSYNSLLIYTNVTVAGLPYETAPAIFGPEIGLNYQYLANAYTGLSVGPTGFLYASAYRNDYSRPNIQIYDQTFTNQIYNSQYNGGAADYFNVAAAGGTASGPVAAFISQDGKYLAALGVYNQLTICSLTNGIPDVSTIYTVTPTSGSPNGRGMCWDAADNIYVSSSGLGAIQSWTLGFTATATTTGNASGQTGFALTTPGTKITVYATNSVGNTIISQANTLGNATSGQFVITRAGNLSTALTIPFALTGTAPASSYTISSPSAVVLAPGQASTNISVVAVTDGIPRPINTLTLSLTGGSQYVFDPPGTATFTILNTSPDQVAASALVPSMYNVYSNDYAAVLLTRWGDTNAASFTVTSYSLSGTAVAGSDYTTPGPVTFVPGQITNIITFSPLNNGALPTDTVHPYVGNKSIIVGALAGTGFSGSGTNSATLTIIDSALPTSTVLYSDPLTDPNDATNWAVTSANDNMQTNAIDSTVAFGYNLQGGDVTDYGAIPLPPSGAATALRVTVNKDVIPGAAAGVNLYPTNVSFSDNYAVRFNMNLIEGYNLSVTTEGALMGINHNGTETNWWSGSGVFSGWGPDNSEVWASDGVWYWITADGGAGAGDYITFTGNGAALPNTGWEIASAVFRDSFDNEFKTNVFTSIPATQTGAGLVANASVVNGGDASAWSDVEIKQVKGVISLTINKTLISSYSSPTNTFTSGTVMLGYNDPFDSVGTLDASVYFSNLRVVRLGPPFISQIIQNKGAGTLVINFTTTDGDAFPSSFTLESSSSLTGPFTPVASATITSLGGGAYQAVTAKPSVSQFYIIAEGN
jgi:hypothetical protein